MTYQQYRTVRRLVHECSNYQDGNCLLLDNGWDTCVCVQSISYSLLCRWFRAAVLPLDGELCAALLPQRGMKICVECRGLFRPGSNRAKYCSDCAPIVHRRQKAASERRRRASGVDK